MRYELTDEEWTAIKPMPPNKPRGVPRVNDRRVLKPNTLLRCWPPERPRSLGPSGRLGLKRRDVQIAACYARFRKGFAIVRNPAVSSSLG
jgi:hypothetical protein